MIKFKVGDKVWCNGSIETIKRIDRWENGEYGYYFNIVDKILKLGYTLEQLKAGELNDIFSMHVREYEVKGELWRQHCLVYKGKEVICKSYKI